MISVVGYTTEGSDAVLKELSQTQLNDLYDYILDVYANSGNGYYGLVSIGSTGNVIGTFTDTTLSGNTGEGNITIISNTYDVAQNTSFYYSVEYSTPGSAQSNPDIISLVTAAGTTTLQANIHSLNNFADNVISRLVVDRSIGSFYLGTSSPGDGDTWISLGELDDLIDNTGEPAGNYFLWKKTVKVGSAAPIEPIYLDVNNNLAELSSTNLQKYLAYVERRMASTGIGQYVLQSTAPSVGTWISAGTIQDTRLVTSNESYIQATYENDYLGATYEGSQDYMSYISPDTVEYEGSYAGAYLSGGGGAVDYTATYLGAGEAPFNDLAKPYAGQDAYDIDYLVPFTGTKTLYYITDALYTAQVSYFVPATYTSVFTDTTYVGPANYVGAASYLGPGTLTYTGPATSYQSDYASFAAFLDPGPAVDYILENSLIYELILPDQTYTGGGEISYDSVDFTISFTDAYTESYLRAYTGPATNYTSTYTMATYISYTGPSVNYDGVDFTGTGYDSTYSTDYTGNYNVDYTSTYIGPDPATSTDYLGAPEISYDGVGTTDYAGLYTSQTAEYGPAYIGTFDVAYETVLAGETTETISSVTLWLRVA